MEEYEIEENGETGETIEPIDIIYKEKNYNLNFKIKDENIIFSIIENEEFFLSNFTTNIELKEFKNLSTEFKNIKSYNDLYNYIKPLSDNKKINIKKNNDKITLILLIDKQPIEIDLFRTKKDIDYDFLEICKELSNVKEKIKDMDKVKNVLITIRDMFSFGFTWLIICVLVICLFTGADVIKISTIWTTRWQRTTSASSPIPGKRSRASRT